MADFLVVTAASYLARLHTGREIEIYMVNAGLKMNYIKFYEGQSRKHILSPFSSCINGCTTVCIRHNESRRAIKKMPLICEQL